MDRKRILAITGVLVLVIVSATVSWVAGSSIQSPAEAAARTAPPAPAPILAPVEARLLTSKIVTRGTARFGSPRTITLVPSTLKPDPGVITSVPTHNTQLTEGDLLLTVSGRPIFVLQGEIPAYRNLGTGSIGDDVLQLEQGLVRMGYDPGAADGVYDEATSAAVTTWYSRAGWQPLSATDEQRAMLRALEQELAVAMKDQFIATAAAKAAPLVVEAARAEADAANAIAAAKLGTIGSGAERDVAQAAAKAAQLSGEVAIQAAIDAQSAAEREAQLATDRVTRIGAEFERMQRESSVKVPVDELVFMPILPVRVEQIVADVGDRAIGPVMTVTNNQLVVDSSLPVAEAPLVKPGMVVVIDEPDLGVKATGIVTYVAANPGTDGVDGFHIYFETYVDETPGELAGYSLRLTIAVRSTGEIVTVVPISALSLIADGTTTVQVERNGEFEPIVVEPGLSADGFVAVTPVDGVLVPGEHVLIGYDGR